VLHICCAGATAGAWFQQSRLAEFTQQQHALVPLGKKKVDYRVVPWCTFTDPEAARVGMIPEEAKKHFKQVRIVKFPWAEIDRAQTDSESTGFIKLVLAGKKDEIVGAHMVGA
jgi:pyruvate/2-oxoglutarate dehydrogenase complex dihydrolipoamide dehydrogenase (E3) component